jgi:CHASE3 domain sensor protein
MTRLSVRLSLLVICLAAVSGAAYLLWSSSRTSASERAATREFADNARIATVAIADLRAAQQSYVAVGQGEDFWFARVTAIKKAIDDRIATLRAGARAAETAADLEAAATALQEFMQMDLRARDLTRGRQLSQASDMIYADGLDLTKKAADAIDRALTAEALAGDAQNAADQQQQATTLGAAAAISLLTLVLLVPVPRPEPGPAASLQVAPQTLPKDPRPEARPARVVVKPVAVEPPPQPQPAPEPQPEPKPVVDLDRIATLCRELARVPDTQALPALLERTATVLDASGLIVWIADPDGRELSPILIHGYPPKLAMRLGTIPKDASNVTASAFRTGLLQTVKRDAVSEGAIAVPLVAASGCVGVMAAEMRNGGEQQGALLAAASIVASQLATLVGPPSARSRNEAAS